MTISSPMCATGWAGLLTWLAEAGVRPRQDHPDPGFWFRKNYRAEPIPAQTHRHAARPGLPDTAGCLRKGFVDTLNLPQERRLEGSLAANAWGVPWGRHSARAT